MTEPIIQVDLEQNFRRKFVPANANMGDWGQVEPLFANLLERKPGSVQALEQWLRDYSELGAALSEEEAKRYIAMTSRTDDPISAKAYQDFVEQIAPKCKPLGFAAEKQLLANPYAKQLPAERYKVLLRKSENMVQLFREQNVPLETQDELLAMEYQKIRGAMTLRVWSTGY